MKNEVPLGFENLFSRYYAMFEILKDKFVNSSLIGQEYRELCFNDISSMIIKGIKNLR